MRGIRNRGENNCFLNVIIQTLWNLDQFREALAQESHQCDHKACIFCALQTVFTIYSSDNRDEQVDPNSLRQALSTIYPASFSMGEMADSSEALGTILEVVAKETSLVDRTFELEIAEQVTCNVCGNASEPKISHSYTYLSYVANLHAAALQRNIDNSFSYLLQKANDQDVRRCSDEGCLSIRNGLRWPIKRTLRNKPPKVLSLALSWPSSRPASDQIQLILNLIEPILDLNKLFYNPQNNAVDTKYGLKGVVFFCRSHYVTIAWRKEEHAWFLLNDSSVSNVGNTWYNVKAACANERYVPVLLLYVERTNQSSHYPGDSSDMNPVECPPDYFPYADTSMDIDMDTSESIPFPVVRRDQPPRPMRRISNPSPIQERNTQTTPPPTYEANFSLPNYERTRFDFNQPQHYYEQTQPPPCLQEAPLHLLEQRPPLTLPRSNPHKQEEHTPPRQPYKIQETQPLQNVSIVPGDEPEARDTLSYWQMGRGIALSLSSWFWPPNTPEEQATKEEFINVQREQEESKLSLGHRLFTDETAAFINGEIDFNG